MSVEITEVIQLAKQGNCGVYKCRGEDGHLYWVKGHNASRPDQIRELICAKLARSMNLPVAQFEIAYICETLYEVLPASFKKIGFGPVFASKDVPRCEWVSSNFDLNRVDRQLAVKVLLFDLWIQNMDRQTHNSNLLFDPVSRNTHLIDHNLAFDTDFNLSVFFAQHIFSELRTEFQILDMFKKQELTDLMNESVKQLEGIEDMIPNEWNYRDLEQTMATNIDYKAVFEILNRVNHSEFWSAL